MGETPALPTRGGDNVPHGSDFYQCDGGETIQPETHQQVPLDSVVVRRRPGVLGPPA
ncbi:MAG: hypothetical protein AB7Q17_13825 [Phycisphaerae bacterium]